MRFVVSAPTFPTPASAKIVPTTTATTPASTKAFPSTTATTPATAPIRPFNSTAIRAHTHPRAHPSTTHISTEAIVIAVIAALLLLACAAWAFARSRAYEPHWLISLRHAMAEAGFRTSATWAEFTDWARLGR